MDVAQRDLKSGLLGRAPVPRRASCGGVIRSVWEGLTLPQLASSSLIERRREPPFRRPIVAKLGQTAWTKKTPFEDSNLQTHRTELRRVDGRQLVAIRSYLSLARRSDA